jgi:hypothetical protein
MDTLPDEIIKIILEKLPMTGKRNFIRCNHRIHKFHILMRQYEKGFIDMIEKTNYVYSIQTYRKKKLCKYTLEILYMEI